jgi:NAD(P)-dependent dehydrogenase (short-subunit alcohol dehydrogenase family)
MRLEAMTALVTGATSGIGRAVAETLSGEGARLVLTGRRPELATPDDGDLYVSGDLNDEDFVRDLAARAAEHCGGHLDVVVLCHGRQVSALIVDMDLADAQDVLHGNLLSAFTVMKHTIPLMRDGGGSIVCVSSRLGMVGKPEETMYSAAKGGLIALARGAAIELADRRIRVNVVAPGLTSTEIIEASFERQPDPAAYRRMRESAIPLRRLATPQEVADAVLFMASPDSSYVTGAVLPVDGGYTAY